MGLRLEPRLSIRTITIQHLWIKAFPGFMISESIQENDEDRIGPVTGTVNKISDRTGSDGW